MNKIVTIFASLSVAVSPFALPAFADEQCEPKTVEIVSDTTTMVVGDGNASLVPTPHHPNWTASITGADWIWKTSATAANEVVAFEKDFTVEGAVLSAMLDIATDNSYEVFIDGSPVAADPAGNNFQTGTQDTHNLTANISAGTHTLRVEVLNIGTFNQQSNPAGLMYRLVVESECCGEDGGDVTVVNHNGAYVENHVSSSADTGGNTTAGSTGGNGGNAGGVLNQGTGNHADRNTTGNGGRGGASGIGGTVVTGNATAGASAETHANSNDTEIDGCNCGSLGDVAVKNKNRVMTKNIIRSKADSGNNTAYGSTGGNGGSAGSVQNIGNDNDADRNTTGNGGNGGAAAGGELDTSGVVSTGNATSFANVLNKLNRNVTRILR